jgi:hypothetical protein
MSCMECGKAVKNVSCEHRLAHAFWQCQKGYFILKMVRAVKLIACDFFCRRDPYRSPASVLKVRKLVARVQDCVKWTKVSY